MTVATQSRPSGFARLNRFSYILAGAMWLGMAAFFGIAEKSWHSAFNIILAGAIVTFGIWAFFRLLLLGLTNAVTASGGKRLIGFAILAVLLLALLGFFGGVAERIYFVNTGRVLPFTVKTDYGDHFPPGELDRLRKTDCASYGPLFIVQTDHGYVMRCGDYLWSSHTYLTTTNPVP